MRAVVDSDGVHDRGFGGKENSVLASCSEGEVAGWATSQLPEHGRERSCYTHDAHISKSRYGAPGYGASERERRRWPSVKWWVYELIFCGWVGGDGDVGGGDSGGVA
jgi:hypothetical protein